MATFTETSAQTVSMSATSTPVLLNASGSPTVAYLTVVPTGISQGAPAGQNQSFAGFQQAPSQLHSAFVAFGNSTVSVHGPQDGALVTQNSQRFVLSGATYIAAVNGNGDGLLVVLGTEA